MNLYGETDLSGDVISAAIAVHRELGPGLDEPKYQLALTTQLQVSGIPHIAQYGLPVRYKGVKLDCGYRIDVLVDNRLVVECKSVESIHPVHEAQLLTYLRLSGREVGLLVNFNVPLLKDGIRRKLFSPVQTGAPNTDIAQAEGDSSNPRDDLDDVLTSAVIAAAIEVHRNLGPGLLRSSYEECLCYELSQQGIAFRRKHPLRLRFLGVELPGVLEVPLLVDHNVPVLCLSAGQITQLHTGQLRGMLKQGNWKRGLVLNFNVLNLVQGLCRVTHDGNAQGSH
jgi:GxxExxY protein